MTTIGSSSTGGSFLGSPLPCRAHHGSGGRYELEYQGSYQGGAPHHGRAP